MYNNSAPQKQLSLPSGCHLRQANSADKWSIVLLVLSSKLDPAQLRWQQFSVIEFEGNLIACGQLRNFLDVQELGSLVVNKRWRNRGLGSLLTQHLISQATQPLYLECLGEKLSQFYSRFGFVKVSFDDLPSSLKRKFKVSQLAKKLLKVPVVFMKYQSE
jgi:amino-acid N-acetyltransferase